MKLSRLLEGLEILGMDGDPEVEVGPVVYDSRKAEPGCLFAALRGVKADGAAFIKPAVDKGAAAVLYEKYKGERPAGVTFVKVADARLTMALVASAFYGRPSEKLKLAGITGTNGKTTTSYLIKAVLESAGSGVGLLGTISYRVGDKVLPAPNTTPESVDLQSYLAGMVDAGAAYAVLEVSSHSLSMKRVAGCEFKVKVFTNFTQDHLDFHGSMEEYYGAKKMLFTDYGGTNVINLDDPKSGDLVAAARGPVITYGINMAADVSARDVELGSGGLTFTLAAAGRETRMRSGLVGRHNVYNILAAAGTCIALGISPDAVSDGISNMAGVPGRFEKVDAGQGFAVLVDYAHTEDALERAISAAREFTTGRLITLFGCGGDRDRTKRPKMGRLASMMSDVVVLTSDNPRTEDPLSIMAGVEAGIKEDGSKKKGEGYFAVADRGDAIRFAVGLAKAGDTVLLAGKGHEDYQIIGDTKYHFDDRETARDAILAYAGRNTSPTKA